MGARGPGSTLQGMTTPPFAHEMWFQSGHRGLDWSFAFEAATLLLLASVLAVTVAVRLLSARWNGVDVPALGRLAPWMPFAVRVHLAVALVGLLSMGFYLSPDMDLQATAPGIALGAVMGIVAIAMVTGYRVREAALLLVAAGPLGMLEFGVQPVLQRVDVLGLAAFLLFAGAGRWSADEERGAVGSVDPAKAIWALRVAAGSALVIVAFNEKLANPALGLAFLANNPDFNVAQLVGLGISDLEFVRIAGGIEVLFGLLVISGALPQVCVLAAGVPFNLTLWFFGANELMGHLPIYGAMLVLLVYGSDPALRAATKAGWPFGRPSLAGAAAALSPRTART